MESGYRESGAANRSILVVAFAGKVFGLNPAKGTIEWEHRMGGFATIEVLVKHGRVYACDGTALHCLDYETGRELGKVQIPDHYKGRPTMVIERDRIFIGSQGEVTAFTLEGRPLWSQGFKGKGTGSVTLGFPDNLRQADRMGSR